MNNKCDLVAPIECALARQVLSGHTETRKGRPIDNFFGTVIQHSTVILSCVSLLAIMVHYLREHHTALTDLVLEKEFGFMSNPLNPHPPSLLSPNTRKATEPFHHQVWRSDPKLLLSIGDPPNYGSN